MRLAPTRTRQIARYQRLIEGVQWPRLFMGFIVALAAAVGFLASFALLHAGVDPLWLRYPMAIAVAYLAFLFLLWCWLRVRHHDVLSGVDLTAPAPRTGTPWEPGGGRFGGGGASGSFDAGPALEQVSAETTSTFVAASSDAADAGGVFDLEELGFVLVAIAALIGAVFAAVWIIWAAPALLTELMLDAALATGLYRRLHGVAREHWLRTAIRRTVWPFIGVALLFSLAGGAMQIYAPHAKSIGAVIQHVR
jgi:hypothetical protein